MKSPFFISRLLRFLVLNFLTDVLSNILGLAFFSTRFPQLDCFVVRINESSSLEDQISNFTKFVLVKCFFRVIDKFI